LPIVRQVELPRQVLPALHVVPFAANVGLVQTPDPLQVVLLVQLLPSSHAVPLATFVPPLQKPEPLHFSPVVQPFLSSHGVLAETFTMPWLQLAPEPLHCSPCVQGLPSLQGVPEDAVWLMQAPSLGRQLPRWHTFVGCGQTFGVLPHVPLPLQVSIVHLSLSKLQVVPAGAFDPVVHEWSVRPEPRATQTWHVEPRVHGSMRPPDVSQTLFERQRPSWQVSEPVTYAMQGSPVATLVHVAEQHP
jgi:hypothetical protein